MKSTYGRNFLRSTSSSFAASGGLFYWKARRAGWRRRRVDGVLRWVMK